MKGGREGGKDNCFSPVGRDERSAKLVCLLASNGSCLLKVQFPKDWKNVMEPS